MTRTVAFRSLGCKLNQYEIQAMREEFAREGFVEVTGETAADVMVLNTCTVTRNADRRSREMIRSFHRTHPEARIIVTGCYADADRERLETMPGVAAVLTNAEKGRMLNELTGLEPHAPARGAFGGAGVSYFRDREKAFVKVQDGCNHACSYCVIPRVRGGLQSRQPQDAVDEVRRLLESGHREIVLCGVCLGSYGRDLPGRPDLIGLVRQILEIPSDFRLRLSSVDPRHFDMGLADLMHEDSRLAPHLHLSLQSGSGRILKAMRRGYTAADYRNLVSEILGRFGDIGLTTDVIVGFPGEDDEAFEQTRSFLAGIPFHRIHFFSFSPRPRTAAALMKPEIPAPQIRSRLKILKGELTERLDVMQQA
ncbi:MAG: tRNA (N(6)-L-threonylcarbamoyladenosine(37)-C(2))-methylthiotransferase MtaB, partial [Candidatus Omnitrophica bacterium]|nr:tRNA (N(6)-L-threonylcarbamoyladenosine(37)-C(2))-methylthiotransferase MtaB [Candidatus Omnitrophota bacterium]